MTLVAVFCVSMSSLVFEVTLTRVFAISQWNHLAFMVISLALFGFAASGTTLNLLEKRRSARDGDPGHAAIGCLCLFYPASSVLAMIVLTRMPLDYFRLPVEPVQGLYLLLAYIVLSVPFFFAGMVMALAYTRLREFAGAIYCASMGGSACGAMLPFWGIPLLGESNLILITAMLPLAVLPFNDKGRYRGARWAAATGLLIATALCLRWDLAAVQPSAYKSLSQALQLPGTELVATWRDLRGRVDAVTSPYIRFAPGFSLTYHGDLPPQKAVYIDGDNRTVLYAAEAPEDWHFARALLSYTAYGAAAHPSNVLLLQKGGGTGIACALASGAGRIEWLTPHPRIARILQDHYGLSVRSENPRAFLARTRKRFDIIQIEDWGSSLPGSGALEQSHWLTREAFSAYLRHLSPGGRLTVSRRLLLPPTDSVRLFATALEVLAKLGCSQPLEHIAVLRSWDTFTLIVCAHRPMATGAIRSMAGKANFDLVFLPDLRPEEANRFNRFREPFHYNALHKLARAYSEGTPERFWDHYLLDAVPQADSRPFPQRVLRWSKLKALYTTLGSRLYALLMSGEIVVAVLFGEALLVAAALLALPLLVAARGHRRPSLTHIIYFLGLGAGFLAAELFFIKAYVLLLGDPVLSLILVLGAFLIFSAAGGYCSQRLRLRGLRSILAAIPLLLLAAAWGLHLLTPLLLQWSPPMRSAMAVLWLLPVGFCVGAPFPAGMRMLPPEPSHRAYAWAANGCTSVLASIASAQTALSLGIPAIAVGAAAAYVVSLLCALRS